MSLLKPEIFEETLSGPDRTDREILKKQIENPHYLPTHEEFLKVFGDKKAVTDWLGFGFGKYEILTREFVEQFSQYLSSKIISHTNQNPTKCRIVEVGAGDGRLSEFLNRALQSQVEGLYELIPTDSGDQDSWNVDLTFPVIALDNESALKLNPHIIICSWMPQTEDWTANFRRLANLKEYILIGDPSHCGCLYQTWGQLRNPPDYERDGFTRFDRPELSRWQLCSYDILTERRHYSETVSFERQT